MGDSELSQVDSASPLSPELMGQVAPGRGCRRQILLLPGPWESGEPRRSSKELCPAVTGSWALLTLVVGVEAGL